MTNTHIAALALLLAGTSSLATAGGTTAPIISADQVEAGRSAYASNCALCHGADLRGGSAPALVGQEFMARYGNLGGLHEYISSAMPPQAPGMLDDQQYRDILAYILAESGAATGPNALTTETLADGAISLVALTSGAETNTARQPAAETTPQVPSAQAYTWGKPLPEVTSEVPAPHNPASANADHVRDYSPVTDALLESPPAGEWLAWRRTLDNQGFSPLTEIDRTNVSKLELAWAWPTPGVDLQQAAPLMHDGLLFLSASQNVVQALDARTGNLVWEYRPALIDNGPDQFYVGYQQRRQKNSIALYEESVVLTTADARIIVLDAKTGKVQREKQVLDHALGYGYTSGPLVIDGTIYSGISGCSTTGTVGGCFLMAHDFETLEEKWRVNTIDDPANPEQEASWGEVPPGNRWGAAPWVTGSYDFDTHTVYWGTGAPGPYTELIRGPGSGPALYANSTLAVDGRSGELKWYFQHLPNDNWDLDSAFERILVDVDEAGTTRRLLVTVAGKNGIFFALDRDSGEYLWSSETVAQNVVSAIDADGTVHVNEDLVPRAVGQPVHACPSISGGKLWQAASYSPLTGRLFVPLTESCNTVAPIQTEFTPGNTVASMRFGPRVLPEGVDQAGLVEAIAIGAQPDEAHDWEYRQRTSMTSSMLATAGGIVFGGDAGRVISACGSGDGRSVVAAAAQCADRRLANDLRAGWRTISGGAHRL